MLRSRKLCKKKYGIENLNTVHHYETIEIKDSLERLILPAGKIVDENFQISYQDNGLVTKSGSEVRVAILNYEYEVIKNNEKTSIYLLKPGYLQQFLNDMRDIMIYGKSSQYVNDTLIRTENTRSIGK